MFLSLENIYTPVMYEEYYSLFGNMNTMYEYRINYMLLVNKYNALAIKYNRLLDEMAALKTSALAEISVPPPATSMQARDMSWNPLCPLGEIHSDMERYPSMSIYVNAKDVYGISISEPDMVQDYSYLELFVTDASGDQTLVDFSDNQVSIADVIGNHTTVDFSNNQVSIADASGDQTTVDFPNNQVFLTDACGNQTTVDFSDNQVSIADACGNQTTVDFLSHHVSIADASGNQTTVDFLSHQVFETDPSGNQTMVDVSNSQALVTDASGNYTSVNYIDHQVFMMDATGNQTMVDFANHAVYVTNENGNETTVEFSDNIVHVHEVETSRNLTMASEVSVTDQGTRDLGSPTDLMFAYFAQNNLNNELAEAIQHHSSSDSSDTTPCMASSDDYEERSLVEDPNKIVLHLRDDIHHPIHIPATTNLHHFHHNVIPQIHQEKKKKKFGSMHFS